MKPNLLPSLSNVELIDKDGKAVQLHIRLYQHNGRYALFMADVPTAPTLARNAATFIGQLVARLELPQDATSFYRHIYMPHQGSVFGCFQLGWQAGQKVSHYTFSMMTPNIEDLAIRRFLNEGKVVPVSYAKLRNLAPAV